MAPVLACVSRTLSLSWRKAVLSIEGGQKRWLSQLRQILTDFENIFIGSHLAVNLQICHTSSIFCCTTLWLGLINLFFFHFVFINKYCVFSLGVFSWWASFKPATENKWNVAVKKSYETWWQHVFDHRVCSSSQRLLICDCAWCCVQPSGKVSSWSWTWMQWRRRSLVHLRIIKAAQNHV